MEIRYRMSIRNSEQARNLHSRIGMPSWLVGREDHLVDFVQRSTIEKKVRRIESIGSNEKQEIASIAIVDSSGGSGNDLAIRKHQGEQAWIRREGET